MYLKKVDIQGFKSFPNKTTIEFKDGITAIVGPNGSGKSNVSDAIKWALGEQSTKSLRGQKMEDVIFAGSSKRKAVGRAEVGLTFNNDDGLLAIDYREVSIKRRIFRSGESEYYINNRPCRLKDIRELFMDTGVGTDGYSIIGQGKIDEILSNKPEDRRYLFEEASGITKYKSRKLESERKLERTEENLTRIEDILSELRKQYNYLKREGKKAEKYKELKEEYGAYQWDKLLLVIEAINRQLKTLKEDFTGLKELQSLKSSKALDLKKEIDRLELEALGLEEDLKLKRESLEAIYRDSSQKENSIKVYLESEKYIKLENTRIDRESIDLRKEVEAGEKDLSEKKQGLEKLKEDLLKLKEGYKEEESSSELEGRRLKDEEAHIEDEKKKLIDLYQAYTDKKGELASLENFSKNILSQLELNSGKIEDIKSKNRMLEEELEAISGVLSSSSKEKEELIENLSKLDGEIKEANEILKVKDQDLNSLNLAYNKSQSELNVNRNMEENYEGYYKSVKSLMVNAQKSEELSRRLVGVVADLMEVDEKYTKAIEVAMGSSLQHIVVDNEDHARYMIDYLKENRLGRATFLPLNVIKSRKLDLKLDYSRFKICGLASDLVSYDERYRQVFENILGRLVVVEDLKSGIDLARSFNHSFKIVSLDGDIINPGGSMTGGSSFAKANNILNRKNIIEGLELELEGHRKTRDDLMDSIGKLKENIISKELDLKGKENQVKDLDFNLYKLTNDYKLKEHSIESNKEDLLELEKNIEVFSQEKIKLGQASLKVENQVSSLYERHIELKEKIKNLSELHLNKREEFQGLSQKLLDKKLRINSIEDKLNYEESSIKRITSSIEEAKLKLESMGQNFKSNLVELGKIKNKLENLDQEIADLKEEETRKDLALKDLETALAKRRQDLLKLYEDLEIEEEALKDLRNKEEEIKIELTKQEIYLEGQLKDFEEVFKIPYSESMVRKFEDKSQVEIEESLDLYEKKIYRLGNVNLGSLEDFKAVEERLNFIMEQVEDLTRSKSELEKIISDMELEMSQMFLKSFNEIRDNFRQVFVSLFKGGRADIILEDEKNILSSGIEIKAQPPGKKFQSLSLLSGGERSLTAVALLFSILTLKPTPFCILDEIDASLDEANIERYTAYLNTFSDKTQFIMITHRKTTMEIADIIYGVTMEEEGVSKTVSLELKDN